MTFQRTLILLFGLLGALCTGQLVNLTEQLTESQPALRFEPSRRKQATLSQANRERFLSFDEGVRLTYYCSPRAKLPPHLMHLESNVRDVLGAFELAATSAGLEFSQALVYPAEHPDWADALASTGLAPWRARRVEGDGYREDEVWSSLRIAYGARPAAVINGVGPEQVLMLQNLVLEQLEELRTPRRPRIALSIPEEGYDRWRELLRTGADLVEVDFDQDPSLPPGIDMFFWFDPKQADNRHLAVLDGLRTRGASVVLAGHGIQSNESVAGENIAVEFERGSPAMDALLRHHGLIPVEQLLLDPDAGERVLTAANGPGTVQQFVPWYVRCTANHQDFRTMRGQPNGSLLFRTPSAFFPDPVRLDELGLNATVLATAGDGASLHPLPAQRLDSVQIAELRGRAQPNAALAAVLRPGDPWGGRVMALADSAVFGDEHWDHEHYAHVGFAQVLLSSLLSGERLVAGRIALQAPALLPELASSQRLALRAAVVLLIPALLGLAFFLRHGGRGGRTRKDRSWLVLAGGALAGALVVQAIAALSTPLDVDMTADGRNRMTKEEQAVFEELLQEPLEIELIFSAPAQLPPSYKPLVRELQRSCQRLASEFDTLSVQNRWTEGLDEEQLAALGAEGIQPLAISSTQAEGARLFRIYAAMRLRRGAQQVVLEYPTERSFRYHHFRLAHALGRLASGNQTGTEATRLALFGEPPRLSPAEASLEYQRKGLFAPREGDVYSELEDLLSEFDFDVVRLEAGRDALPEKVAALLWMQPRRDLLPMAEVLANHLAAGGGALVAGQHFRMMSRQLEGSSLQQRFWPEPQFFDLDKVYLPELGIEVPRVVCFDSRAGSIEMQSRVDLAEGGARYTKLPTTKAFLIQPGSEELGSVRGQWLFPYANQVRWNESRLDQAGLRVTPWIHGGMSPWAFAWQGGDLDPQLFEGKQVEPPELEERVRRQSSPACYAALFQGPFPPATLMEEPERQFLVQAADASGPEGSLLLFGASEQFKNEFLTHPDFDHESLVLRSVASLALPKHLVPLLKERKQEPALAPQDEDIRSRWKWIVLGAPSGLLLLFGLLRRRVA